MFYKVKIFIKPNYKEYNPSQGYQRPHRNNLNSYLDNSRRVSHLKRNCYWPIAYREEMWFNSLKRITWPNHTSL